MLKAHSFGSVCNLHRVDFLTGFTLISFRLERGGGNRYFNVSLTRKKYVVDSLEPSG
jgi:hypothetical protein